MKMTHLMLTVAGAAGLLSVGLAAGVAPVSQPPAERTPAAPAKPADPKGKAPPAPYPLGTCPISGKKLGAMGDPVVKVYDGREVRFCCGGCPPSFEKDQAAAFARLDEAIVKDQTPFYPLDTSVVSGVKLGDKGKPFDFVHANRLVRLAAESEKAEFLKDPRKHLAALDRAVIDAQSKDYPLKTCPVSDEELGSMGESENFVLAGRLILLCCASCEKDVRKDPAKFIAKIDDARKANAGQRK